MIVFQPNINKPTQVLDAEVLKSMIEHPANIGLIDSYRQMKRRMAEAEARQAVGDFVNDVVATNDYKRWLAAELKKDQRRSKKRMPASDLERVKLYITQKKSSLPAIIPTIAYFVESKDRWGRVGLWRVQQYGYLSGLAVVDGDHVPNPEERIAEWLQREDFKELGIVCIFITPSGEGVKVIFKAKEEFGNLQDNAYQMAEKLGILDYCDSQTKNSDHAHFIPKADDVKYIAPLAGTGTPAQGGSQGSVKCSFCPVHRYYLGTGRNASGVHGRGRGFYQGVERALWPQPAATYET